MALLLRWSLATLLLGSASVLSDTTEEKPIILNEETTISPPIILNRNIAFEMTNPTHVNGEELFESDMLLSPEQKLAIVQRKAISSLSYRWRNGINGNPTVPYMFSDGSVDQVAVRNAMTHWEQHSCIRFQATTNFSTPHLRFIYGNGCWSAVGMQYYKNGQNISIGNGCNSLGTVVHEIGHALGFFHEQSRSDRNSYVYVNTGNIISGTEHNFQNEVDNNYSVPYDYTSDMHYGDAYLSKNGCPTLATKDPMAQPLIGQRSGLSHYDKLLANRMYSCTSKWLTTCGLAVDPCKNNGYTGASCTCVCPAGTSGTKCETVTGSYYDSFKSSCSGEVTTAGNITSPNYPGNYPAGVRCMKVIKAPACTRIQLKFNSFRLYQQNPYCNDKMCCYYDALEIRTTDPYNGTLYCDAMISAGQVFTSSTGQMLLYFKTGTNFYTGWSAEVSFIPTSGCISNTTVATTTTSTTTTRPTTTTTAATTTLAPANVCPVAVSSTGGHHWTSPRFGQQNYPNSFSCSLSFTCLAPLWVTITFNRFSLENRTSTGMCNDYLSFTRVFNLGNPGYCGLQSGSINLPVCNFAATFYTNFAISSAGFNITITGKSSSCHQLITTGGSGSTGNIAAPAQATTWQNTGCEWWIEAPTGNVISLQFTSVSLSGNCTKTSILLNGSGNPQYPTLSSTQYCGTAVPPTFRSTTNKLNVMYYSTLLNSPFAAKWTVVATTG